MKDLAAETGTRTGTGTGTADGQPRRTTTKNVKKCWQRTRLCFTIQFFVILKMSHGGEQVPVEVSHVGDHVPAEEVEQHNIDENNLPKRTRQLTQKGKDYQIEQLTKRFSNSRSRIDRQCQLITQSFDTNNYQVVQREMGNLDKFFAEAEEHHTRLIELLPDEDQAEQHNKREQIDEQTFKMKHQVCTWLKENESTSRSGRSRSRSSHHSAGSHHSQTSRRSRAASEVHSLKKEEDVLMRIQLAKKEELAWDEIRGCKDGNRESSITT